MDNYQPTENEIEKINSVSYYAINWAAIDIRKAAHLLPNYKDYFSQDKIKQIYPEYEGGSMVGSVILAFCVLQYTASFYLPKSQTLHDSEAFIDYVDKYMPNIYTGTELYSVRNSLFKEYTTKFFVKSGEGKQLNYIIGIHRPDLHMSKSGDIRFLNLENLAEDVLKAVTKFYNDVREGKLPQYITQRICEHYNTHLLQSNGD